ncbi:MAG: phytanoyl-CoA dioxygenase family protein [Planctomycetes bacterium]|nr:phytanoyl-CoA dioxygenase family protein [Planctomycetota bacterium]
MSPAATAAALTPQQIAFFKHEGYVVLEGAIEPAYIQEWRRQVLRSLGGSAETPVSWGDRSKEPTANFEPKEIRPHNHPAVRAVIEQLGGGRFVCGHDSCVITWPQESRAWAPTDRGHLDGYNSSLGWWPFMVSATTYLYDVEPMGGGLTLWPGSHTAAWNYFRARPDQLDGGYIHDPDFNWKIFHPRPPHEFTARAGDVVFWHAFMLHNGSTNISRHPRVGLFTRWRHEQQERIKYEVPESLWKYWAI